MFADGKFGIPNDLIEAAKRVRQQQLEEAQREQEQLDEASCPGYRRVGDDKYKCNVTGKIFSLDQARKRGKYGSAASLKKEAEEFELTDDELAEAFAMFLEENFHVDMLTEEDLDYVFEEEFPEWLEEQGGWFGMGGFPGSKSKPKPNSKSRSRSWSMSRPNSKPNSKPGAGNAAADAARKAYMKAKPQSPSVQRVKAAQAKSAASNIRRGASAEKQRLGSTTKPVFPGEDALIKKERLRSTADAVRSDTMGGRTSAPKAASRTQVRSSRPAPSARKRTGGPSLFQQSKRAVRSTPGDPGRTAIDRLKYMAKRGNRASIKALRGPKKPWSSTVFSN